tara:strand:+ start:886 stop:1401 length:516 start_codon:yes stop_codon:yes gene_type:complete
MGYQAAMAAVPADRALYERVKREARRRFDTWPSAYASGWLVREYKRRGGTFPGLGGVRSEGRRAGIGRWFRERWVQVRPYLLRAEVVDCGSGDAAKACRPLRRVDERTPATVGELVAMHGREKLLALSARKRADPAGRVYWKRGTFHPAKPAKKPAKKLAKPRKPREPPGW